MTYEELKEIKFRLDKWREQRHLSYESQQKGFMPNILEELREYYLATSDDERVAELCDVVILCLNVKDLDNRLEKWMTPPKKGEFYRFMRWILNDISCMVDYMGVMRKDEIFTSNVDSVIVNIIHFIFQLGYNPYECLKEKVKEIESRTGHYDKRLGKFVKDIGAYSLEEAKKLAYERLDKDFRIENFEENDEYFSFLIKPIFYDDFGVWREIKKWHKAKMVWI